MATTTEVYEAALNDTLNTISDDDLRRVFKRAHYFLNRKVFENLWGEMENRGFINV